jgi:hypothetical protein
VENNPVPLTVRGLDADGIPLISPQTPQFDTIARPLIGSRADRVLRMKPMLVVVENATAMTIVAISLTWRIRKHVGGLVMRTNSIFPHALCGDQAVARQRPGVLSGEHHLVASSCVVEGLDDIPEDDGWIEAFVRERDRAVEDALDVAIELDAVIFDDGRLIGPDEGEWLSGLFSAYMREKQQWYRGILDALNRGKSVDEAYAPVRAFQEDTTRRMMSGDRSHLRDTDLLWKTQAAADAAAWRRHYADAEIPALLASIRLEPFVIRR